MASPFSSLQLFRNILKAQTKRPNIAWKRQLPTIPTHLRTFKMSNPGKQNVFLLDIQALTGVSPYPEHLQKSVPVLYPDSAKHTGAPLERILSNFKPFKTWLTKLSKSLAAQDEPNHPFNKQPFQIKTITIQSIDYKGPKPDPLFIKLTADVKSENEYGTESRIPGIVLLRGGSVGMLVILEDRETGEEWVPLTIQPRVPVGSLTLVELPAGMLDNDTFAGAAAKELKEECKIDIKENQLINLGELALGRGKGALYPSAGGCDESISLFACKKVVDKATIERFEGEKGELYEDGEKITLKVVRLKDLWKETQDFKALAAWGLYKGLTEEGKIEWPAIEDISDKK